MLSPGLTNNTFTKHKDHCANMSVVHLQQRLHDLRERELVAKQHNRQLMQQFEEAQDTLRDMLNRTAAMKTLRAEYERYLESCPHWHQQLRHQMLAAEGNETVECIRTCLKNSDEQLTKSNQAAQLLCSQGLGKKPGKIRAYQESDSPLEPHFSWQTQAQQQTAIFPYRMPNNPWDISKTSPLLFFPQSHPIQPQPLSFTPTHRHYSSQQEPSRSVPSEHDYPRYCTANSYLSGPNALCQLHMNQPFPQSGQEKEAVPNRPPSKTGRETSGDSNTNFSQELDVKPVRLSSGQAESSESSQASSQGSTERRKTRVRKSAQSSSSDVDQHSSHKSSQSRAAAVSNTVATDSEGEDSEKCKSSKGRRGGLDVKQTENDLENSSESHNEENETKPEESESDEEESPQNEPPETLGIRSGNGETQDTEKECNISDESSLEEEEEDPEKGQSDDEGKESSLEDGEDAHHQSIARNISEEGTEADDETQGSEDDDEDQTDNENSEESILPQGEAEDNCIKSEDKADVQGSNKEKEQRKKGDGIEEDSDSEDCIISPQSRSKIIYVIPEHPTEHVDAEENGNRRTPSSDDDKDSSDLSHEDNIELLLAPQEQTKKNKKEDPNTDDKPKAICYTVAPFGVEQDQPTDHPSDSDDHFYD